MIDTTALKGELEAATAPALMLSGGKDSVLLLLLTRQLGYDLPVIHFPDGAYDADVMQLVMDYNLTCYSWCPANLYLLANDGSAALIREFSVNGELLPVLTNVHADSAGLCLAQQPRTPQLYLPFDLLLTGYKDCDTHWAADGTLLFPEGLVVGGTRLTAPLRQLSDSQVLDELSAMGVAFIERDDEIGVCADCMAGKPLHWDRPLDLTAFRSRVKL